MKQERLFFICSLVLALAALPVFAQGTVSADPATVVAGARALSKLEHPFPEKVARIVAVGEPMVPHLRQLIVDGEADRLTITALGFLTSRGDTATLAALEAAAFPVDGPFRPEAAEALLRIGGPGLTVVLDHLAASGTRPADMAQVLAGLWRLPERAELARARTALARIAREHPDSRIRKQAAADGVARLDAVLAYRRQPSSPESFALLQGILERRDPAFVNVHGGAAELWALEGLAASHPRRAAVEIRAWVDRNPGVTIGVRKRFLATLAAMGATLRTEEVDWMREHAEIETAGLDLGSTLDPFLPMLE